MGLRRDRKGLESEFGKMLARVRNLQPELMSALNDFAKMVGQELDYIEKYVGTNPEGSSVPVLGGAVLPSSGAVVATGTYAQKATLVAGTSSQVISFTTAMSRAYILFFRTYNAQGDGVGVKIVPASLISTGFTVTDCMEACTIEFEPRPIP